jgi:hypothetical protein
MPGTQAAIPQGCYSPGKPPHRANRLCAVAPPTNEATTVLKNRQIHFLDFEYDTAGERVLVTETRAPIELHVEDVQWYQGGLAALCGRTPGPATSIKLVDDDNVVRDLGFVAVHGTTAVRAVAAFTVGSVLFYWVCDNASTDMQLWCYYNGKHHAYGALASKTLAGAMSTKPLAWAERTLNTFLNTIYTFYPSGTNTAVIRQFVPENPLSDDPFLTNTSEVKQDGPLYLQTVEIAPLPEEANSSLMALQMQSRRVDDNTSYGSVVVIGNTSGDHAFSAQAWTNANGTFDATSECFTDRAIVTSNDPGVAVRTIIHRITLDHQASSAETPCALPFTMFYSSHWPPLERFGVVLDENQAESPEAFADRLKDKMATKSVQRFRGQGRDFPAMLDMTRGGYEFEYDATKFVTAQPRWSDMKKRVLYFAQTPGATS